jgi:hypothetical protein
MDMRSKQIFKSLKLFLYRTLAFGSWTQISHNYIMYARFDMMASTSADFVMYSKYEAV